MKKTFKQSETCFQRPLVSVDVVIFAVLDDRLKALLVRRPAAAGEPFPGAWALPGGFIDTQRDGDLFDCAVRKLREKTGVATPYLEQLGSWGGATRDPRGWSATHAYFALIAAPDDPSATMAQGSVESAWHEVDVAVGETLAFDHQEILAAAIARLRSKVEYTSLPAFLLAEPFTLPELQHIYAVVLGRSVDKSAFRKRMLDAGFLAETGMMTGTLGRLAMGYRIKDRSRPALFPRTFRSGE